MSVSYKDGKIIVDDAKQKEIIPDTGSSEYVVCRCSPMQLFFRRNET